MGQADESRDGREGSTDHLNPGSVASVGDGGGHAQRSVAVAGTTESSALISMIERAARDPNVDIDKMERLFLMHERVEQRSAKTAYLSAFARLQSGLPAAIRAGTGHNSKKYARYEDIVEALRPVLAAHGFSLSHRVNTAGERITVTGILGHEGGHSEETQFSAPPDTSGNKTQIHAIASTISYGKRYVTLTLTGIATEGEDDDAKKATAGATITEEQAEEIKAALDETGGLLPRFCAYWKLEKLTDLPTAKFTEAMNSIKRARK